MMNSLEHIYDQVSARKNAFFVAFFLVSMLTYAVLYALDFYPEPKADDTASMVVTETISTEFEPSRESIVRASGNSVDVPASRITATGAETTTTATRAQDAVVPIRVVIPKSGTDVVVLNPDSLDMSDLDTALLDGVVRHPQSAHFTEIGNILIFGHSSYLPTVFNKNFQAFNGVQDLVWGDTITLYADNGRVYTYRVDRVYAVKASETIIDNGRGKAELTLVTCNSFGSKDDRFVVEATLIGSES